MRTHVLLGAAFALLGTIGLARLPDFFTRLHGPTKATTLGVGEMALASALYFTTATRPGFSLHEIAVMVFLFITAPVSAHLLAKAHCTAPASSTTAPWKIRNK